MFQTFTGNSRRPRQVNLSGRSGNPFAASATGSPKSAIDSAKEERIKRQQERERTTASSTIQRRWRGYNSRRKTFSIWRGIWDQSEQDVAADGSYESPEASLQQLNRLLLFFSPAQVEDDSRRLRWYGMRQVSTADKFSCNGKQWRSAYGRLRQACVESLAAQCGQNEVGETLRVLAFATRRAGFTSTADASQYYSVLTQLDSPPPDALQHALLAPLAFTESYAGLAVLLSNPLDHGMLDLLKNNINEGRLIDELVHTVATIKRDRDRLWLLGNTLALCSNKSTALTSLVLQLLGKLVGNMYFEAIINEPDNRVFDREYLSSNIGPFQVNDFLYNQIHTLISETSIRNLLAGRMDGYEAQLAANMVLTLLRCFPRKADEIRMWLYMGPTAGGGVSACLRLWQIMKQTVVFETIRKDSRLVVAVVRASSENLEVKNDWATILLFLELYTFALKVMDDEDFLGKGKSKRAVAIPIGDVADLVTFLKNLGFSLCYQVDEFREPLPVPKSFVEAKLKGLHAIAKPTTVAGISGVNTDDLKGLTVGLMRAIYDRDSRRHFLPRDHWLMTTRFDMTAFIASVVQEEENRHQVLEDLDNEEDDDAEDDDSVTPARGNSVAAQNGRLRSHRKQMERRRLESVAPRLEILQNMPFFIPFDTRVQIFREFVARDQIRRREGQTDPEMWRLIQHQRDGPDRSILGRHHATIRRGLEVEDAYKQFYSLGVGLKEPIQITFEDGFGLQEAGIDGGGVTKEFLTSFVAAGFSQEKPYFVENETHLLHPNPLAVDELRMTWDSVGEDPKDTATMVRELLRKFEFLGRVIGKCLYEGILIDVSFAGFFLKKWALTGGANSSPGESGYRPSLNDLRDYDEGLYRGLLELKNAEDASDFGLSFAVDDMINIAGVPRLVERSLGFDGADTAVTNENRLVYISALTRYRLQKQSEYQTNAFLRGLSLIIQPSWLSMFNQSELQTLIGGAHTGIDVQDLRRNTSYGGTYVIGNDGQEHPSVKLFWRTMESLSGEERGKVLKFVTSTPRGPLLGFAHLRPPFSIRDSGSDENRFPTTSTCVNLLKLPMYKSEETMRRKLLEAVNSGAGFDLS